MELGRWLRACSLRLTSSCQPGSLVKRLNRTRLNRIRQLAVENFEARRMLAGAPFSNLHLLTNANQPLIGATSIKLDSYVFGGRNDLDVSSGGVLFQTKLDALNITADLQENSASIFSQIAKTQNYASAVLTQRDANGDAVSVWVLSQVSVVSEEVVNDGNSTLEQLGFSFDQITEASSQLVTSWDTKASKPLGPAVPPEISLKPYASISTTTELKLFASSTDATPAVTLKLSSFAFGVHNPLSDSNRDPSIFDRLQITAPMSSASPALFGALTTAQAYPLATLTQRDATGSTIGMWTMRVAALVDESLSAGEDSLPILDLDFVFGTLGTSTQTSFYNWDITNNRELPGGGPLPPGPIAGSNPISPASRPVTTGIKLDLQGGTADTPISLFLDSFSFGFHSDTALREGIFTAGHASFDSMDASLALPNDAPRLLAILLNSRFYATATLTQKNSAGEVDNIWVLGTAYISDTRFTGEGDGTAEQKLSFKFLSIAHAAGNETVIWNQATSRAEGPALPVGQTLVPLPASTSPLSLNLFTNGSTTPAVSLPIESFNFRTRGAELLDTGSPAGGTEFDPLEVAMVYQNLSPKILTALVRNTQFVRATISKSTTPLPLTLVNLGTVFVTSNSIAASDGETPSQIVQLGYGQITESARPAIHSWDVTTAKPIGPAPMPGPDMANLPVPTGNVRIILGDDATSVPDIDLSVDSSSFGFERSTSAVLFDSIKIQTALGPMSPKLLAALTTGQRMFYGRVTQVDGNGDTIADWQLRNVFVSSITASGDRDTTSQEIELTYQAFAQQVGNTRVQWDRVTNSNNFPQVAGSPAVNRSPSAPRDVQNGLVLELNGSIAPDLTLPLDSFELGYLKQPNISLLPLEVSVALTTDSARLLGVLTANRTYETAVIKQYDNSAFPTAGWVLTNLKIRNDQSLSSGDQAIKRLSFTYATSEPFDATTTRLVASSPTLVYGQSTTLTATITVGSQLVRSGDVTFVLNGQPVATVPVDATGKAVYQLDALTVAASPYLVEARYEPIEQILPSSKSLTVTVKPAVLTITADNKTKTYGTANPPLTATISGLVNNDSASVVTGLVLSTTATTDSRPSGNPYPIIASQASAANYDIQYVDGALTITPVELTSSGVSFTPVAGAPFSGTVALFSLPSAAITTGSFIAQISWGDGRSSSGIVTQNGNTFVVTGKRTFSTSGAYNVLVSIRHSSDLAARTTVSSLAYVTRLGFGQTQTAAYWNSSVGQSLIKSFNGGSTRTELANWLATTYPNIYGAAAGANNLSGKTNANVASLYLTLTRTQKTLDQEVLATALNIYASTLDLGGTAGGKAGFMITRLGLGAATYNVGARGAAFNVADNSLLSVSALLDRVNSNSVNGALYSSDPALRPTAEQMLEQVNLQNRSGLLSDQVQTVTFWTSDSGVSLIKTFGGANSRQMANWLTSTFRNLYGPSAGVNNLVGKTNAQVATYLQSLNSSVGTQTAAQVLTLALNLYASTLSLGGPTARTYGFNTTEFGLGAAYFNIDQMGSLAGVANRSSINVYALLQAIDRQSPQGNLLGSNATLLAMCRDLSTQLNGGSARR